MEELFEAAKSLSPEERTSFLEGLSGDDLGLRNELESLLDASEEADATLDRLRDVLLGGDDSERSLTPGPGFLHEVDDPWLGREVAHYRLTRRLGSGGMGVVYWAHDTILDRGVALKFIAPEISRDPLAKKRFLEEARAASAVDHPNICTVHEIGETDSGRLFMVMPAYDGETLRERLARERVSVDEALEIAEVLAGALGALHARGIVHCDVKPANVLITDRGTVKLLDFGVARTGGSEAERVRAGTPGYMSPEQLSGGDPDPRWDVWAAGAILFEMLAGRPLFDPEGTSLARGPRTLPDLRSLRPGLDPRVTSTVEAAMEPDSLSRLPHGSALKGALTNARRARTLRSGHPRRALTLAATLAVVAIAAALWMNPMRKPRSVTQADTALPPPTVSRVLWVDDNPENNGGVIERLNRIGVPVTTALSTAEGVERFAQGDFHFVVSDIGRFEEAEDVYTARAGFQLVERLRARDPDVRIVFCTSYRAARTYGAEALAAGVEAVLTDCGDLLQLVTSPR